MFLSRRYRPNMWPYYGLVLVELSLTVALLTLTGIAAPNLYRTKLWQDGADNGFNSSPLTGLYAAANYRPYTTPRVWSHFVTSYSLVCAVLSMFLLLCKSIMFVLHVLPPVLSVGIHTIEITLYAVAVAFLGSPDLTDKQRPQHGPAWYITKSCSVTHDKSLVGYCAQAKATFACFCAMLGIFILYWGLSIWSCIPSRSMRAEHQEKKWKRESWSHLDDSPVDDDEETAWTNGLRPEKVPVTPRTFAFNRLNGKKDLPLRVTGNTSNLAAEAGQFGPRSPAVTKQPVTLTMSEGVDTSQISLMESATPDRERQVYFPPPPVQNMNQ